MILFFNHVAERCGVQQFGRYIAGALYTSSPQVVVYVEVSSLEEHDRWVAGSNPEICVYNYYPSTMPWLHADRLAALGRPSVCIVHECSQGLVDNIRSAFTGFTHFMCPDPTLNVDDRVVFKSNRLVPRYPLAPTPKDLTIGSFGFGFGNKGYMRLVSQVQSEFDEATIRLHIPYAQFGDAGGEQARQRIVECVSLMTKPGINIETSHDFFSDQQLLAWLASNSLNAFFYDRMDGRGIASTTDFAMAVGRPIAITKSAMFRHIWDRPICIEEHSLRSILERGDVLEDVRAAGRSEVIAAQYNHMFDVILGR
jgi:hypothetical protein